MVKIRKIIIKHSCMSNAIRSIKIWNLRNFSIKQYTLFCNLEAMIQSMAYCVRLCFKYKNSEKGAGSR